MNFDLARPLAAVSRSRDFQQMNNTEIARKQLEIREKVQRNTIGKLVYVWFSESIITFDLACPLAAVSRSRGFQQMNKTEIARKRLDIRKKLQGNSIGKPGSDFQKMTWTLT